MTSTPATFTRKVESPAKCGCVVEATFNAPTDGFVSVVACEHAGFEGAYVYTGEAVMGLTFVHDEPQHSVSIEDAYRGPRAVCSCGWASMTYAKREAAESMGEDHLTHA